MSGQGSLKIPDTGSLSGLALVQDTNAALAALVGKNGGAGAPANAGAAGNTTEKFMDWADTSNNVLKRRNAADTGWVITDTIADAAFVTARSSNTILGVSDFRKAFVATSTFTQTLTAAATLGDGWWCAYRNDGVGVITLDPNAAELIDGAATIALSPGDSCLIFCNGTKFNTVGRPSSVKQPTRQVFTTGSGTYTTPVGATRINVRIVGGGGGGAGSGTTPGAAVAGGNTTFSTLTANGGGAGGAANGALGAGGAASGGDINLIGGDGGGQANIANSPGGGGGVSAFGGNGPQTYAAAIAGNAAKVNTGSGGSGAGCGATVGPGGGGGAGGHVEKLITAPAATYSYGVGAGGAGGTLGTGGGAGGGGGSGIIIVDEEYN